LEDFAVKKEEKTSGVKHNYRTPAAMKTTDKKVSVQPRREVISHLAQPHYAVYICSLL